MKLTYDECTLKWSAKGIGLFDSPQEAWKAIKENEKTKAVNFFVSRKMYADLQRISSAQKISVSEFIRRAIEKEVQKHG